MRCNEVLQLLDAYRTAELGEEQAGNVGNHLAGCTECAAEFADIERIASGIAATRTPAPAGIIGRVLEATTDQFGEVKTELGTVQVAFNGRGITMVYMGATGEFERYYERRRGRKASPAAVPESYAHLVQQAAAGEPIDRPPVDLEGLPPFERKVLELLLKIPRGEVRPYLWLAREAGSPGAVRAVGNTMARNPIPFLLPCHRVVPAEGGVGNYAFGSRMKRDLLCREGVPMDELDELARKKVRFVGCKSTGVYCFPTCRGARRMLPSNRVPFSGVEEAHRAGYRACMHCRPEALAS